MVSNQTDSTQLKNKLEGLGVVFFNPPETTDKIIDGIRDPLIEHIINDLTQTLPRFIATQDNKDTKDKLLTCLNDVLTNIFSSDSPSQTRTESIKGNLTNIKNSVETKIEKLELAKASNHSGINAETHPLKSLKRSLDILRQLDKQVFEQVFYLIKNIFDAKIDLNFRINL